MAENTNKNKAFNANCQPFLLLLFQSLVAPSNFSKVTCQEPNVLRGMNLEAHQEDFPVFQLELGGTWTDSRHDEDQWGQYAVAMYLTALGYLEMFSCFFQF